MHTYDDELGELSAADDIDEDDEWYGDDDGGGDDWSGDDGGDDGGGWGGDVVADDGGGGGGDWGGDVAADDGGGGGGGGWGGDAVADVVVGGGGWGGDVVADDGGAGWQGDGGWQGEGGAVHAVHAEPYTQDQLYGHDIGGTYDPYAYSDPFGVQHDPFADNTLYVDDDFDPFHDDLLADEMAFVDGGLLDDDVYFGVDDFEYAEEEYFVEDYGSWTDALYDTVARALFGGHTYYGEPYYQRFYDAGYELYYENDAYLSRIDSVYPGCSHMLDFYMRDGAVVPYGVVPMMVLDGLVNMFPGMAFGGLHVTLPPRPGYRARPPRDLPPAFSRVTPRPAVDMRRYCSPVDDQLQTARCSAYAWTHALETAHGILGRQTGELCANFTMMQIQRLQGDFRDYRYARRGGSGTDPGPAAGRRIIEAGTCRQALWPDEVDAPLVSEDELMRDAAQYRIAARALPVRPGDLRRVLSAGCPVVVSMNTGPQFANVGRDGMVRIAEKAQGQHGRHAMLIVGYRSNYYIAKNSWGSSWGDNGYCYVPKRVLAQSDPELIAMAIGERRAHGRGFGAPGPVVGSPSGPPTGAAAGRASTPSKCPTCLAPTTQGAASCPYCGAKL